MAKVTIYTTPTCTYCRMAKSYFKDHGIEYSEYDVSEEQDRAEEMLEKSGQMGVPVIDIGGKIIVGFDRRAISEALGI
ncbi:MAG: glutathione S-transferase N-terminal domain-containing protein [archaeon]|nr:glutathione S-transferase N-terminal domain-containing protein [archaeon]